MLVECEAGGATAVTAGSSDDGDRRLGWRKLTSCGIPPSGDSERELPALRDSPPAPTEEEEGGVRELELEGTRAEAAPPPEPPPVLLLPPPALLRLPQERGRRMESR